MGNYLQLLLNGIVLVQYFLYIIADNIDSQTEEFT